MTQSLALAYKRYTSSLDGGSEWGDAVRRHHDRFWTVLQYLLQQRWLARKRQVIQADADLRATCHCNTPIKVNLIVEVSVNEA
jgi:hypothetical protein